MGAALARIGGKIVQALFFFWLPKFAVLPGVVHSNESLTDVAISLGMNPLLLYKNNGAAKLSSYNLALESEDVQKYCASSEGMPGLDVTKSVLLISNLEEPCADAVVNAFAEKTEATPSKEGHNAVRIEGIAPEHLEFLLLAAAQRSVQAENDEDGDEASSD